MELIAVALANGAAYVGGDFRFDPPVSEPPPAAPTLAVIGTGKRVAKTAISAHLARLAAVDGLHPVIVAMGTGRMLRAMVEQLTPMDCPQHKVVSLVGNIAPDGSASLFDVVSRIGDRVKAPHYPMPLPVIATTVHEKSLLLAQKPLRNVIELARQADVTFVGIGTVDEDAALLRDGFVKPDEIRALVRTGAVEKPFT